MAMFVKLSGRSWSDFPRFFTGFIAVFMLTAISPGAHALFGGFMPLNLSGSLSYNYGYSASGDSEFETTTLNGRLNASGYIWQPWFATTSAALNLGLSNYETNTSSSNSTLSSGDISLGVFPYSRFPFSLNYSRSDSRVDSFQNFSQASGNTQNTITRLTVRQQYEGRASRKSAGSRTSFWYSTTNFDSQSVESDSESIGVDYKIRLVPHSFTVSANHLASTSSDSSLKPTTDVASVIHTYTPDTDIGVTNLATKVKVDDKTGTNESTISQVSSNFFWRPEHRAVNVNGGVRVSETDTLSSGTSSEQKSFNTNLGLSYRLTRRLNLGASASLGSSDTGTVQTLSTTQSARLNYNSRQIQIVGFAYNWQWGVNGSNSNTRTDDGVEENSTSVQTAGMQLGHSASQRWVPGRSTSINLNMSQSGNVNKSSENDDLVKGMSHSAGLSWNRRSRAGSLYGNLTMTDSRSYGLQDSEFQYLNATVSLDLSINRLSSFAGTVGYSESRQKTISDVPGVSSSSRNRHARANFTYRHSRPFGMYNMNFSSILTGSRAIDKLNSAAEWDWDNRLRYRLGLLDTSLSLRIIESVGGVTSKLLHFQATRNF